MKKIYPTKVKNSHIFAMTTKIGFWQFAKGTDPDLEYGYSIDDQTRALILALFLYKETKERKYLLLAKIYLDFIKRAQRTDGYFHNYASAKGKFIDVIGSQDCLGRAIWALGVALDLGTKDIKNEAQKIYKKSKANIKKLRYIRSKAYALLGLLKIYQKDSGAEEIAKNFADFMVKKFKQNSSGSWQFFEEKLIYANAILSYALFCAYEVFEKDEYLQIGLKSFDFLNRVSRHKGHPSPIGFEGWYEKGKKKALFGQQPIDVADMILAAAKAFYLTKDKKYLKIANEWYQWFFGNNIYKLTLYDQKSGGCHDGIFKTGLNPNQGAESTIMFHLANLEIKKINKNQ